MPTLLYPAKFNILWPYRVLRIYLKAMMRDKMNGFASAGSVEVFLNEWLSQYVLLDDGASPRSQSAISTSRSFDKVVENPAQPGHYKSVVFLRPFQLDELSVSLRLVTELPQSSINKMQFEN